MKERGERRGKEGKEMVAFSEGKRERERKREYRDQLCLAEKCGG